MTNYLRTILDPEAAAALKVSAAKEFVGELRRCEREHLVTDAALRRWYRPSPPPADPTDLYGPPESIYLDRSTL